LIGERERAFLFGIAEKGDETQGRERAKKGYELLANGRTVFVFEEKGWGQMLVNLLAE
jgi:hypothetical protein